MLGGPGSDLGGSGPLEREAPELIPEIEAGKLTLHAASEIIKPHVAHNSGENEWYTPPEYIAAAVGTMGHIDTDPASSEIANRTVGADVFYSKEDDGLAKDWCGNIWLNPPYSQPLIKNFADKLVHEFEAGNIDQACILVNNATETQWFATFCKYATAVCFPSGRVRFLDVDGNPGAPLQGQAVIYIGGSVATFAREFSKFGMVLYV